MGLKKSNYTVRSVGIELPTAYAQVTEIHLYGDECNAEIRIHKDRESVSKFQPIEVRSVEVKIDRNQNLLEQIYARAKEIYFRNWEDDIVTEEKTAHEVGAEEATGWY